MHHSNEDNVLTFYIYVWVERRWLMYKDYLKTKTERNVTKGNEGRARVLSAFRKFTTIQNANRKVVYM